MPETIAKKPIDHTGMFWIHGTNILSLTEKKELETMRRMLLYGWKSIPSEWKKSTDAKTMEELEAEYNDPKKKRKPDDILGDIWQLMIDVALKNNMIRGDIITRG